MSKKRLGDRIAGCRTILKKERQLDGTPLGPANYLDRPLYDARFWHDSIRSGISENSLTKSYANKLPN